MFLTEPLYAIAAIGIVYSLTSTFVMNKLVDRKKVLIAVTSDHISSVYTGKHEKGAFPFCLYTQGIRANETKGFNEIDSKEPLGPKLHIEDFMEFLNHSRA